jgi:putative membrane protein
MVYDVWHWHPDPNIIDGLVATTILYFLAVGPVRSWLAPEARYPVKNVIFFSLGTLALWLAVATPLDEISEQYLFSAHMLQHILIIYPVAFFWLLGMPPWLLRPFFAMEWSRPLARFFTKPGPAFVTFNAMFYLWHLPAFYDWALRDSKIHFIEHATFLFTAFLLWWPLVHPLKEQKVFHPGGQLLYLLAGSIIQMPIFGFLAFSNTIFYETYRNAPRIFKWMDPLADQQMGAILMKITAMLVMFGAMIVIFGRWYYKQEGSRRRPLGKKAAPSVLLSADEPSSVTNALVGADGG